MTKFGKIVLMLTLLPFSFYAQTLQHSSPQETIKIKDDKQNRGASVRTLESFAQNQQTRSARRQLTFVKQKRNKEQQKQLLPSAEELNRYAGFLQQPKTGLIRLTNDIGCTSNALILRADEECLKSIPGGSFYSFREREHSSSALADLRLRDGLLITDGIYSQNVLVKLGNLPLENITINSDGMKFLTDFQPEINSRDATSQYIKITKGIRLGKYEYIKVLPTVENATYAMRLIAYRANIARVHRGYVYNPLAGDSRSDVILAFRIVKKDSQGITILWKELERKKAPKIELSR